MYTCTRSFATKFYCTHCIYSTHCIYYTANTHRTHTHTQTHTNTNTNTNTPGLSLQSSTSHWRRPPGMYPPPHMTDVSSSSYAHVFSHWRRPPGMYPPPHMTHVSSSSYAHVFSQPLATSARYTYRLGL